MAATTARRSDTPQGTTIPPIATDHLLKEQPPHEIHHDHHHHHHDQGDPAPDDVVGFVFDGEDLIFSSDDVELEPIEAAAFPSSLPDFKCLSSSLPNGSANVPPRKSVVTTTTSLSSSSSSSSSSSTSSNWPFLRSPDAMPGSLPACSSDMSMQPQHPSDPHPLDESDAQLGAEDLLVGSGTGVDGYDFSVPWDSDELFPLTLDESGACSSDQTFNLDQLCPGFDDTTGGGAAVEGEEHKEEEGDDLSKFFLEWLKNNKDAISPEDLRSIRLKKSTIECAARRLGPDRRGRMQLVKLILSWVQNHHLQRKKARLQEAAGQLPHATSWFNNRAPPVFNQAPVDSVPPNPNPNHNPNLDFDTSQASNNGCNPWLPTSSDPYSFQQSCTGNGAVVNGQLYSPPVSDLHATDPAMSTWDQSYNAAFAGYPLTYPAGLQAAQLGATPIVPHLYHQGQSMPYMASATKEARRKRMARQRRLMSVQQSRVSGQGDNPVGQGNAGGDRNWAFWSSLAVNTHQGNGMVDLNLLPAGAGSMFGSGTHERGFLRQAGSSASEKRQGFKSYERNLRFLLQKVLKQSDVGSLGRIVLPKKEAEIHLPELDSRDGITIPMEDIATSRVWNMRYRFWPNNKSRMYLLENTGDFVRSNRLEEGDFIVIYSDVKSGKYMIRGVKVKPSPEKGRILTKVEELKRTSSERSREDSTSAASSSLNLSSNKVKAVVKCIN